MCAIKVWVDIQYRCSQVETWKLSSYRQNSIIGLVLEIKESNLLQFLSLI